MSKKKTKEEFIKEATEKHEGKYDYSKVEYVNAHTKVCIICPEHGEFWQTPNGHLKGCGCTKCANEAKEYCRSSKEDFIKKARKVHGDKYKYTKVVYVNNKTKVCIICPEHGEFWQTPSGHLQGQGCPTCGHVVVGDSKRSSLSDFIKKARKVHGDKYDYSKVEYIGSKIKVCIICPEHGKFEQIPNSHLRTHGCPKCKGDKLRESKTLTKEEFIKKAREIHKDKYDYSKVDYMNSRTKICIICPQHGEFWQEANGHLSGRGCPKCANEANGERCRSSKEDFIKKANEKHGDKYDYSKVTYVNDCTKITIHCPEHGNFEQTPNSHLNGRGCPKCGIENSREKNTSTKEEFIEKAREVHGNKYDYSNVEYVGALTKVCIICPKHGHGEFWQRPVNHTRGIGCPKCNLSHLERSMMNYLDEVGITYDYQKCFKWMGRQSLDFYLPDYNVGIECQGGQHFFPVERFGGDEMFKKILERDKRKKALCEKNGVKLLYFGNTPNYDTFLGEVVHDDVQYLIDYLEEHKKENT